MVILYFLYKKCQCSDASIKGFKKHFCQPVYLSVERNVCLPKSYLEINIFIRKYYFASKVLLLSKLISQNKNCAFRQCMHILFSIFTLAFLIYLQEGFSDKYYIHIYIHIFSLEFGNSSFAYILNVKSLYLKKSNIHCKRR